MIERILVIGANGMLGGSIHRYFSRKTYCTVLGTVRSEDVKSRLALTGFDNIVSNIDVSELDNLAQVISNFKPDVVFNCVGLIKQLAESKNAVSAIEINSLLPHKIAEMCSANNARLIHFSTDCVFSGDKGMYKESNVPDASDIYGRAKLLGEVDYAPHLTLRTSIIGHELNSNVSLVDWFLNQPGDVRGYTNAFFSGLPTVFVAKFVEDFILNNTDVTGLRHLSVDRIDKYNLLQLVKNAYGKQVQIIPSSDFQIDRSLDSSLLRNEVGFLPPSWPELIDMMYKEYLEDFAT